MKEEIERRINELKANNNLHLELIERLGDRWLLYIDINNAEIVIERKLEDSATNN